MSLDARALTILEEALGLADLAERDTFVQSACKDDADLLARVRHLLSFEESDRTLLKPDSVLRPMAMVEDIPERFGPYRVTGEIARGGMGAVVKAERDDGRFEQVVAIKLLRGDLASQRARDRFAVERKILGRLVHPSIVRILDGGEVAARPWLAMDFVDGMPVDEALAARSASQRERLHAFAEVCDAVAHAHRQLVIHADIKPSNVLMDAAGKVYLLDFGIARMIAGIDVDETGDPYPLTRGFAAPERGVGVVPSVASDVYSLGVMLLVMLGCKVPAPDGPMEPGTRLPRGLLQGDLAAIAARALREDPAERYPDAVSFADDVRRHLDMRPVSVREHEGSGYFLRRFVRRNRRPLLLTALAGTLLAISAVVAGAQFWRAQVASSQSDARFADARAMASYLLFDFVPSLEDNPNSLEQRVTAAQRAQEALDRLASAPQASDAVRLETASGLMQLAILQAGPGRANLGQPEPAAANLERAQAIVSRLSGAQSRRLLARILIERTRLATWQQADLEQAERLALQARSVMMEAGHSGDAEMAIAFALSEADLAVLQGDFVRLEQVADRLLQLLPPDATNERALDLALGLSFKAEASYYQGRPAEALALYRRSLALVSAEAAGSPESLHLLNRQIKGEWEVGTTLSELRQYPEAIVRLARAESLAERLVRLQPADRNARRLLSGMRTAHAQALGLSGRTDAALGVLRANRDALARDFARSNMPEAGRDLAYAHVVIGETLHAAQRRTEACQADREAQEQYAELRRRGWINAFDEANNLRLLEQRIAENCG